MFGLFKKKTEPEAPSPSPAGQGEEFKALAAGFSPEELDLIAVTGANGFGGGKQPGQTLWTATIPLTAWMEEDGPVHREDCCLETLADDKLLEYLRRRVPQDFIIKLKARPSLDGKRFLMVDLPQPGFDPELKSILEEQKKPVTLEAEGLGAFTLNRSVNWFETEIGWLGHSVQLTFDRGEPEEMDGAQNTARALLRDQQAWDARVREYAAGQLLGLANDWAVDGMEEDEAQALEDGAQPVSREDFIARMELESIQVDSRGGFEFWFNDGQLFWGHAIHVTGSLEAGPDRAQMEG